MRFICALTLALLCGTAHAEYLTVSPASGGAAAGITVNTTTITGGTPNRLLRDNAGTVGETAGMTWDATNQALVIVPADTVNGNGALIVNANAVAARGMHAAGIHIAAVDAQIPELLLDAWGNRAAIACMSAGGTAASPAQTAAGQELCRFSGRGWGSGAPGAYTDSLAGVSYFAGQALTTAAQGSYVAIRTVNIGSVGAGDVTGNPFSTVFEPGGGVCIGTRAQCEIASGGSDLASGVLAAKTSVTIGAGSAITSSGPGGALASAAFVSTGTSGATVPLNNGGFTQSGTANFTSTFQINGNAITWPAAAISVARIDAGQAFTGAQTISNGATLPSPVTANVMLQVAGTTSAPAVFEMDAFAGTAGITLRRANTSSTAPSAIVSANVIANTLYQGYNGAGAAYVTGANIRATATATTWDGTHNGAFLEFLTSPDSGGAAAAQLRIQGSGGLSVGNANITTDDGAGGIRATKYNLVTITAPATGSTFTIADGKTLTASNSITLAGTDATTMTFPATSATIARTDVGQTFTGSNTFSSQLFVTNSSTTNAILVTGGVQVANSSQFTIGTRLAISSNGNGSMQHGGPDAAAPVTQTISFQSVVAGNANTAGANATIQGSLSNGSGGGDILIKTTLSNASSGTQNTAATSLTFKGGDQSIIMASTTDATSTSTGALQIAGGVSITKRVFAAGLTASAGLQTAVICLSSANELIADSVACLASSERFKQDIAPSDLGLAAVMAMKPIVYRYAETGNARFDNAPNQRDIHAGFRAEDLAKIDRRLVAFDADGAVRTARQDGITASLVKAVQEQQAQIDTLRRASR